jgi:hypothetical protein
MWPFKQKTKKPSFRTTKETRWTEISKAGGYALELCEEYEVCFETGQTRWVPSKMFMKGWGLKDITRIVPTGEKLK